MIVSVIQYIGRDFLLSKRTRRWLVSTKVDLIPKENSKFRNMEFTRNFWGLRAKRTTDSESARRVGRWVWTNVQTTFLCVPMLFTYEYIV